MANLTYASPFFIVTSLKTSVSFYVDKLGFEVRYIGPDDDPFFAIVGRDHISIMLKQIAGDVKPIPNHTRHKWARWDTYISAAEPDTLFEEYRSRGVAFHQPIEMTMMVYVDLKLRMLMDMFYFSGGQAISFIILNGLQMKFISSSKHYCFYQHLHHILHPNQFPVLIWLL